MGPMGPMGPKGPWGPWGAVYVAFTQRCWGKGTNEKRPYICVHVLYIYIYIRLYMLFSVSDMYTSIIIHICVYVRKIVVFMKMNPLALGHPLRGGSQIWDNTC